MTSIVWALWFICSWRQGSKMGGMHVNGGVGHGEGGVMLVLFMHC
jgi:hypothetical protein